MIAIVSPALHTAAHLLTVRAIQSMVEGSLIGLFAIAVLRLGRQNAGTRFAVWFASLVAIAAVPVVSGEWLWHTGPTSQTHAAITLPDSWALSIFAIWALVSAWFLLGVARGVWYLRTLRRSCIEVDLSTLDPILQETIRCQKQIRDFALCTSSTVRIPTAIGLVNPAVVIPDWVMQELSTDELNQILLHEFAHLRRWDDWTNLAVQFVKAIFFFHPVVWWIERETALEREMACDDAVLAQTESARTYAECLTHLAEKSLLQRTVALAHAALGRVRQTTLRVTRILDSNRPQPQTGALKPMVSLIAVLAVGCGLWSARTSSLIAFEGSTTDQSIGAMATNSPSFATNGMNANVIPAMARSSQVVGITQTKLKTGSFTPKSSVRPAGHASSVVPRQHNFVQLTSVRILPVPITEAVFVLIPNPTLDSEAGQLYQIQMWHVVVLRTVVNPATTQISHKEI